MPDLTANVRDWGFAPFPASEMLRLRFVPSTGAVGGNTILPQREQTATPNASGVVTVTLAQTTNTIPASHFKIIAEWFQQHPILGWVLSGFSEIPGELHVPAQGGNIIDLMNMVAPPGSILYGFGPPPSSLTGVAYIDISGAKPVLYAPQNASV